jgi:cytochrome c biogenesis protein
LSEEKKKNLIDKIWDFFASVKLAIILFALIATTSIVGTILEQRADPTKNIQILNRLFGESLGSSIFSILDKLGFTDMYHSWWFISLLVLFAINLIICSLERLPRALNIIKEPLSPLTEERIKRLQIVRTISLKGNLETSRELINNALKTSGFNWNEVKEEKGYQYYSQKGKYSRLGVYFTHLSILIILIGVILGISLGFTGFINLPEGAATSVIITNNEKEIPLGFSIRCDNFDVEFYGRSDMPKEYRSWLTIFKNGKAVKRKAIVVNDPLTYEGITFYQASFGTLPNNLNNGIFIFRVISKDGIKSDLKLRLGDSFQIPSSTLEGKIIDFSPALRIDQQGRPFTYTNQMYNPAVYINFYESGKLKFGGWILRRYPETWLLPEGHRVEFHDYWGVEYTGLQVRKDPGVWVVYLGCIIMSIGLFIAFFISHRRIWIKVSEDKNNTTVIIGGTTNKNKTAFEEKIDKLVSKIVQKREGGR